MSEAVIEIEGLKKTFGNHAALDGLDLRVPAGSVFGFLGRNGAGKTTTIKHLPSGPIKSATLRRSIDVFGQVIAPLFTHQIPWVTIIGACVVAFLFLAAALTIIHRRDY